MKAYTAQIVFLIFMAALCKSTTAAFASEDIVIPHKSNKLRLVANYWEPFTGDDLEKKGIASEIVLSTLIKAGIEAKIEILPWARAYKMVQEGRADGIVSIWHTEERQKYILFSDHYLKNSIVLLKRKDKHIDYKDLSSLKHLTLGLGRGYDYHASLERYTLSHNVHYTRVEHAIGMLYQGRIDAVLDDKAVIEYHVQKPENDEFTEDLEFIPTTVFELPLHFGMSKKYPYAEEVIKKFNDALKLD